MKKIFTLTVIIAASFTVFAQSPQKMSYQAVIRNTTGGLVTNHAVGMRVSILQGSATGSVVYSETYTPVPQTNANGLVTIEIGTGTPNTGTFSGIDWSAGPYYLKTEADPAGGTSYTVVGTSQLISVPYAIYSRSSETIADNSVTSARIVDGAIATADLAASSVTTDKIINAAVTGAKIAQAGATTGQVLKWSGTIWAPSTDATGGGLTLPYSGTASGEDFLFKIINNGQGNGIKGETISGTALLGLASATAAANIGTAGQSASSSGAGVWGNNIATTGNGIAVKGSVQSSTGYSGFFERGRFYIEGNTGIGTLNPGAKLEVAGQVKITGGSPGTGKVLTSDVTGLATWQTPPAGPFTSSGGVTSNLPLTDHLVVGGTALNNQSGGSDDIRMLFNKTKGAFRAGQAYGTEWDDANVGQFSAAFGTSNIALNQGSFASGTRSTASGYNSTVFGMSNTASSEQSTAIGSSSVASGSVSTAIGYFVTAAAQYSTAVGCFNIGFGSSHQWVLTDPVFEVGNGLGETARSNALTILKNGNTGIGTTTPSARLEVAGQVKITGGSPGAGKVLASDANGLAAWVTPQGIVLPYNEVAASSFPMITITNSGSGNGILAVSNSTTGITGGVIGEAWSTSGAGIIGTAYATTGSNYGVKGKTYSGEGYSGYFEGGKFYVSGNVGIGNSAPAYKLDVTGNRIRLQESGTNDWIALRTDGGTNDYLDLSWEGGSLVIQGATTNENVIINPSMNRVGIRTWTPQYELDVNGSIRAIGSVYYGGTTTTTGTAYSKPDFVFEENYRSLSTQEVEDFLKKENHLPWITSAVKEKEENGEVVDMTRMAFETVESVENIQLQVIEQQKLIQNQQKEIDELKDLVNTLIANKTMQEDD